MFGYEYFERNASISLKAGPMEKFGKLSLVFNESMSNDIDLNNITQVMILTVIPDVKRSFDETFDPSHLNMDWSLSNFSDNKLEIQISFE